MDPAATNQTSSCAPESSGAFVTTKPDTAAARPPDLVKRNFCADRPNALWVVDFTYAPCWSGMEFTAFVSDVFSRRIVGWRTTTSMPTELPLDALEMALWIRARAGEPVDGLIHHIDAGSQGGFNWSSQHLDRRGVLVLQSVSSRDGVGRRRQWAADRALRPSRRSPGRPEPSRAVQRRFWWLIAAGVTTEDAAAAVGVSTPVGGRWFRHAGGMSPISLEEPSGRYLSFVEREEIALLKVQDHGVREIARRIGRDPATISRELRRNAATRAGNRVYRAGVAQWKAQQAAKRPKAAKLATNLRLRAYVEQKLVGEVTDADGRPIPGPNVPWTGRRHGRRQDRRWGVASSPEQISNRLRVDFPDDESTRIAPETIYQSLYIQGRGACDVS